MTRAGRAPGYFHPASVFWRVTREQMLLAGGGAALLLQVAHPLVARGVAEHSSFRTRPLARLYATLATVRRIVFAERPRADAARSRLRLVHSRVRGELPDGSTYAATDPQLLYWVHATLMYTSVVTFGQLVAPLTRSELDAFHADANRLAQLLDVPSGLLPADWPAFETDFAARLADLNVTAEAREIAAVVLDPPLAWVPGWARRDLRVVTAALLPAALRADYELPFAEAEAQRWKVLRRRLHHVHMLLPQTLASAPAAWPRRG